MFCLPLGGLAHGGSNSPHFMELSVLIFSKTHFPKTTVCKYESLLCAAPSLIKNWTGGVFKGVRALELPMLIMFSTRCPGSIGVAKRLKLPR